MAQQHSYLLCGHQPERKQNTGHTLNVQPEKEVGIGRALLTRLFKTWLLWPGLSHHFSHVILELFKILLPKVLNQSIGLGIGKCEWLFWLFHQPIL